MEEGTLVEGAKVGQLVDGLLEGLSDGVPVLGTSCDDGSMDGETKSSPLPMSTAMVVGAVAIVGVDDGVNVDGSVVGGGNDGTEVVLSVVVVVVLSLVGANVGANVGSKPGKIPFKTKVPKQSTPLTSATVLVQSKSKHPYESRNPASS
jgi:hypothetical protein